MIEVFKTNVQTAKQSNLLLPILGKTFPSLKINFDLDDCDKILRVQGKNISPRKIIETLNAEGFHCKILV